MSEDHPPALLSESRLNEGTVYHGFSIKELIADNPDRPYAFVRCDFRQTHIERSKFHYVDFTNSDFVGSVIKDCELVASNLMSTAFSACLIEACIFERNRNFNCDIFDCSLQKVNFTNQLIDRAVWRSNKISECKFEKVTFNRSTLDKIYFEGCELNSINFMANYCSDCTFVDCNLDGIIFDATYFGTTIFRRTDLINCELRYKDEYIELDGNRHEEIRKLSQIFENDGRYSEAFCTLRNMQTQPGIEITAYPLSYLANCLQLSLKITPMELSVQHIHRLLRTVETDYSLGYLTNLDILKISLLLQKIQTETVKEAQLNAFLTGSSRIEYAASLLIADGTPIDAGPIGEISFVFQSDNVEECRQTAIQIMKQICNDDYFEVADIRQGSIIIDILTYSGCAVAVATALKVVVGHGVSMYVDFLTAQASRRVIEKVRSTKTLKEISEIQVIRRDMHSISLLSGMKGLSTLSEVNMKL